MSEPVSISLLNDARRLEAALAQLTPENQTVALIYTNFLKLPTTHPFRIANQTALGNCVNYFAMLTGKDPEWIAAAFEQRAETFK